MSQVYPIIMRAMANGTVVRFTEETVGEVLVQGINEPWEVGTVKHNWVSCMDTSRWELYNTPTKQPHPLLNDESKHYAMIGGVEAIELMEVMFTTEELMAWAKLTAMKYRLRIGDKDAPEKEIKKIKTYEAYYKYLEDKSADK